MGAFFSKLCCCSRSRPKNEDYDYDKYKKCQNLNSCNKSVTDRTRTNSNLIIQRSQLICSDEFEFSVYSRELERDFEIKSRRWLYPFSNSNSYGSSWNSNSFERSFSNGENKNNITGLFEYPRKVSL